MMRRGLTLLLLSGYVLVCHLYTDDLVRCFYAVTLERNWTEAQRYCREKFTDLATIRDQTDNTEAWQKTDGGSFWIGLSVNSSRRWFQGDQEVTTLNWFTSWANDEPKYRECVIASGHGYWMTTECEAKHFMVCYSAESNKHILVQQELTWSEARTLCRSKYTDLSNISSQEDNKKISALLKITTQTTGWFPTTTTTIHEAWIGLHRQLWEWSDQSNASYRQWAAQTTGGSEDCAMMDSSSEGWYKAPCTEEHAFLCYADVRPSLLRMVKVQLRGGSADLNDPTVQDAVLQQLKEKLVEQGIREEVKLSWKRQSDGKFFHKQEEAEEADRAPPDGWEEEHVCNGSVW